MTKVESWLAGLETKKQVAVDANNELETYRRTRPCWPDTGVPISEITDEGKLAVTKQGSGTLLDFSQSKNMGKWFDEWFKTDAEVAPQLH